MLTDYDIFYLCFGNFQLSFELGGLRHLAQRGTGGHFLAHLHGRGKLLQNAIESSPYIELIHLDLGGRQLGFVGGGVDANSLLFKLQAAAELFGLHGGDFGVDLGEQALFGEGGVAVSLEFGGVVVGIHLCHRGLHIQT